MAKWKKEEKQQLWTNNNNYSSLLCLSHKVKDVLAQIGSYETNDPQKNKAQK